MKLKNKAQNKNKNINTKHLFLLVLLILCICLCIYIYYKKYYKKINEKFNNSNSNSNSNSTNNNIIIPDIIGGLGNQLFIVASAFAYAKENNYKLMLDNRKDVMSYGKPRQTYNDTIFINIPIYTNDKTNFKNMTENEFASRTTTNEKQNDIKSNIFLTNGYYQEANYFNKYRNELLDLFKPSNDINNKVDNLCKINNININSNSNSNQDFLVAIHIRLDDVYTPIDSDKRVYDKDEYETIINKLPEHLEINPNTKFIIFSNDIPRTKNIFKSAKIEDSRMIYIQSEDYIELALMAKCNNYIASPSTFNWWGIYLNNKANKKVFIYWKQDSDYRKDFYKKYEYLKENHIYEGYKNLEYKNLNNMQITSNFTCVSGFWSVNNKHGNKFNDWFKNTLAINCPYVFFTSNDTSNDIKKYRKQYPTYFIEKNITDFKTYKLNININNKIDSIHVPSKELGLIWLEKMNLVMEASTINPYKSEWFCWIDSGICIYRDKTPPSSPFPNPKKMNLLSKTQINYSTSENISNDDLNKIKEWQYIHNIAGTAFILHISLIKNIYDLFYKYLNKCTNETNEFICFSDQCIWTRIYADYPKLFNKIGNGYGNIINELT